MRALTQAERDEYARLPFDDAREARTLGVPELAGEAGYTTLERMWRRPTLEINGIYGGYQGPGRKTIVPSFGHAKLTARLVPAQDPEHVKAAVTAHLQRYAPPGVRVEIEAGGDVRAVETSRVHPALAAAARAMEGGFVNPPVFIGTGGTIGPVSSFDRILGLPQVLIGVGLPDDAIHAPNEKFDLGQFYGGIETDGVPVRRTGGGTFEFYHERFSDLTAAYVAARPSYPPESVDILIEGLGDPSTLAVADLGAGTGISARVIAARGPLVYAIEPNAKMREAAAPDERVKWVNGTAEATTLPGGSVNVVAAFQAWHWVDHPAGVAEARRILKPGGRIAAIYNERDERDPFTAAYGTTIMKYALDATEQRRADALEAFAAIDPAHTKRFEYVNGHRLDRVPACISAPIARRICREGRWRRVRMHAELDAVVDEFERDGFTEMHLVTLVVRVDT